MRLGAQSLQSEEGVVFSPRVQARYRSDDGEIFEVTFAEEAEMPETWTNPKSGKEGVLLSEDGTPVPSTQQEAKAPRTHWDMLLERRTRAELEQLLEERLQYLRARRGKKQTIAS
jgi:hypothetical protein